MQSRITLLTLLLLVISLGKECRADLMFQVSFTSQAQVDLSPAEQALFTNGLSFWDDIIIGHRDGASRTWTLTVDTFSQPAIGGGVVLGSAGPTNLFYSNVVADSHTTDGRFILAGNGEANFNVHPDAGSLTFDTIKHEIGHALGFGVLWEDNEVYNDGVSGNSNRTLSGGTRGEYVGAAALAEWQTQWGQPGASFVPVETGTGFAGTDDGHWDEDDNFGLANTGFTDSMGRDLRFELMTGFAAPGDDFLSNMSVQSFYDIGFNVNAVPEPTVGLLAIFGTVALWFRRRSA